MRERMLVVPLVGGLLILAVPHLQVASDREPFLTGDRCIACHAGVTTSAGEDVSIGFDWRASMMANSARDPYWQAAVRREILDHPAAAAAIEDKCSRCHMPMASEVQRQAGEGGSVFGNVPHAPAPLPTAPLAADGVSCSACHQIEARGLGTEGSFVGGFRIAASAPLEGRTIYGPFEPDEGGVGIMRSATGYRPTEGSHIQSSELCASCHTLFTHALRPEGGEGPEFPEQVPYQEWAASAYAREGTSCQTCHMPVVGEDVPVTRVLGQPRSDVSRHVFRGGNFFMQRMLARFGPELGVVALPQELQMAAARTVEHLQGATADVAIELVEADGDQLVFDVEVRNLAGHKFPTAYPSRRAWLQVTVRDAAGRTIFHSGAFRPDGSIAGNDNDEDASRYEPHYEVIDDPGQVQIYEAVMVDGSGAVTTGLMRAERWAKDNRLPPRGFDAAGNEPRIGIYGAAAEDPTFLDGGDRVRYRVETSGTGGHSVSAELWFQPIAYRWAQNLAGYESYETERFVRYYREMAAASAVPVAEATTDIR